MKLSDIKKGQYLKYKYSPDDVVIHITSILEQSKDKVVVVAEWVEGNLKQEFVFNRDNILSWKESV